MPKSANPFPKRLSNRNNRKAPKPPKANPFRAPRQQF